MSTAVADVFVPPKSYIGPCVWYHGTDRNSPHAAFITKTGDKAVGLCVVQAGTLRPIQGVLHVDDPDLQSKPFRAAAGGWDYIPDRTPTEAPATAVVAKLTEQVKALEKRLASLEKELK